MVLLGMPRRSRGDYAGGGDVGEALTQPVGYRRGDRGQRIADPRAYRFRAPPRGPRRYAFYRRYAGRGNRPAPNMLRRFRGLPPARGLGIETKFFDTALAAAVLSNPPATAAWTGLTANPSTVLCFNAPTQGSGASNREGRFITMESLQLNGIVALAPQVDQTAADTAPVIKLWLVLDKMSNGTALTVSENVYTNPAATLIGGMAPLRNMLFSKRYKVLKEITIDCDQLNMTYDGTNIEQEGQHYNWECFVNLKGRKTEFSANAGTSADIVNNALFLCAASSSASLVVSLTYNARLRFRG